MIKGVLMLVVRFCLFVIDAEVTKYIMYFLWNLNLSTIAKKGIHSSPFTNSIHKDCDEVVIRAKREDVNKLGMHTNKDLGNGNSTIYSRGIGGDGISGNRFMAALSAGKGAL